MASRKKDTLSKRAGHSMESGKVEKFYRTRARARKLAAEAKDLTEGAAGDKKGKSPAGPSCPVDSNCDATIPASRNENDVSVSPICATNIDLYPILLCVTEAVLGQE